jgi:hypothetical protein
MINNSIDIKTVQIIEHKNTMTFADGNRHPVLGQAQKCGMVNQVKRIPNLCL